MVWVMLLLYYRQLREHSGERKEMGKEITFADLLFWVSWSPTACC